MQLIKVAAAALNQTPLAWKQNAANIREAIARARAADATVLCLPELSLTGYGCEDAFHSPGLQRRALRLLQELVSETTGMIVSFGLPLLYRNALFNTVCVVVDGKIAGFAAKRFLAGSGVYYEPRWFHPWPAGFRGDVTVDGVDYPVGDLYFDCGGVRVGFEICEDAWVAQRPGSALALSGVDIILNPSASHFAFNKLEVRKRFVVEGSRAFNVSYVYANLLGNDSGRMIFDGGALIASAGTLLATGPRFTYGDVEVTTATIDVDATRLEQMRTHSFQPRLEAEEELGCVDVPFVFPRQAPEAPAGRAAPTWETSGHLKEEEFTRAVSLGLFDYMRKSYSNGFVISLSGGADSTACATLVSQMLRLAEAELGLAGLLDRLSSLRAVKPEMGREELTRALLVCVYQATRNSGDVTLSAARTVAEAVGAEFLLFDVDALVQGYIALAEGGIERPLTWERDDLTLQNIQARARGPSIWMLANIRSALLVATSNRSEAAVGYATMDGDTCGGLSPIGGIDKAFLRTWLRWVEATGPEGLGPIPELSVVNAQQPTAELRPPAEDQTDEGDLMPYDLLDAIEEAAIRDKQEPVDCLELMRVQFPRYSDAQLKVWVERFFRLWCRNQWKRERYAPSFHLDDKNLDPKTWCRFPILSGGFATELAELADV